MNPPAPENVCIVRPDGTEIPCEVRYVGDFVADDGRPMHRWEVLSEYVPDIPADKFRVGVFPPRTELAFGTRVNRGSE